MTQELTVAFIGAGRISTLHALGYGPESKARLAAVCDMDEDLARARTAEFGAERAVTDYHAVLEDPAIDAVEVLLPHHLHLPVVLAALAAGKHVSLQKPMARSMAEARAMVEAAAASRGSLRVIENFRHYPPFVLAKELIEAGAIGVPQTQQITVINGGGPFGWRVPRSATAWRMQPELCGGGPCMFDHGWHCFSLAMFLLGPVEETFAWIGQSQVAGAANQDGSAMVVDQPSVVSWRHGPSNDGGSGAVGSWTTGGGRELLVRSRYYRGDERVMVVGTRGVLWVNRCSAELLVEPPIALYRDGEMRSWHTIETDWGESFRLAAHAWHDALLGGPPCHLSATNALEVHRFVTAAHVSAAEGHPMRPDAM